MPNLLRRAALLAALTLSLSTFGTGHALLAAPQAAAPAPAIPATLTDKEFWGLVDTLSEPAGYFQSDNFVGNELTFQYVVPSLRATVKPGGVYMGVGPDQNFTYIAALQPKIAFIVDIRRGNLLQLLMYKALIELSADRVDFAAKLFARSRPSIKAGASADEILNAVYLMAPDKSVFESTRAAIVSHLTKAHGYPLTAQEIEHLEGIYGMFYSYGPGITYSSGGNARPGSMPTYWDMQVTDDGRGNAWTYMASEDLFQGIKRMQHANLIVPITGNFAGSKAVRAVGDWVRRRGATVTTFYLSNVEQYLFQDGIWRAWFENVATLPLDVTSQFIRSSFNMGGSGYGGPRSVQLTQSIQDLLALYRAGRITSYYDVLAASR
jgi:hypothetical protein